MEIIIKPPKQRKNRDVRKEIIQERGSNLQVTSTFPNGFTITYNEKNGTHTIKTSGELIDLGNGCYQVPD